MTTGSPSLRRNSVARLAADSAGLVFGACGTVITSRALGPSGQGVFAVLVFVSSTVVLLAGLGLGEAAVVRVGRGSASYEDAASATLGALLLSGIVGLLVALVFGWAMVQPASANLWWAVIANAVDIPVSVGVLGCASLLNLKERIQATSILSATLSGTTLLGLLLFVFVADLDVMGAVLAGALASGVALIVAIDQIRRGRQAVRPRWNRAYLRAAVVFGIKLQAVSALTFASNKLDLLIVFKLGGSEDAGRYSVALTAGLVVTMIPYALSMAAFPTVAYTAGNAEANALVYRMFRVGAAGSLVTATTLIVSIPIAVPAVLGRAYSPSIGPAIILVIGAVFLSGQWLLGRAAAARDNPGLLIQSFGLALAVMVSLDFILIPQFDLLGAASASSLSSVVGLIYCLSKVRPTGGLRELMPGPADLREFMALLPSIRRRPVPK